jgi:signal transduction histidine kinase
MKTLIKERQKRIDHENLSSLPLASTGNAYSGVLSRVALIDSDGNIVAVNNGWKALARESGAAWNRVGLGANYLMVCRNAAASSTARKALQGIESVLQGKSAAFALDYSCQTILGLTHFRMSVIPVMYGQARAVIEHTDVSDLRHSKEEDLKRLQEFARRLIHAQEEERQRISQEVHDDLGHRIALLSFQVRQIIEQHSKNPSASIRDLHKILDGINDFSTGLRNLSHNLYPPALRYLGIKAALQSLSQEFEKAYGIHIDLLIPAAIPRLPADVELGVFRILQESLQNAAKHSGARKVKIVLANTNGEIRLNIFDMGCGFNKSDVGKKAGLGILSMQQRALSIGASLDVNSSPGAGTEIVLRVPSQEDAPVTVE